MSDPEDPLSLLEWLKQQYGVEESVPPFGPSVVVPNRDYKPEWTALLARGGYKTYAGEQAGRVAWIIPLKAKRSSSQLGGQPFINALPVDSQAAYKNPGSVEYPRSNGTPQPPPLLRGSQGQASGRGCITGRAWTSQEDKQLLAMLTQNKSVREVAKELAPKLDRTERAVQTRLTRLKRRQSTAKQNVPAEEKPVENPVETRGLAQPQTKPSELPSLLESALFLAGDPKHASALRLILEACLRLTSPKQEK